VPDTRNAALNALVQAVDELSTVLLRRGDRHHRRSRRRHSGVVVLTGVVYLRFTYLRFPHQRFPRLGLPRHVHRGPAAIPENEEEDQPDRSGRHEDPADGVEVQPGEFPVHRERQDRSSSLNRHDSKALSDLPPRALRRYGESVSLRLRALNDKNARRRPIEPLWSSFPELRVRLARQRRDMSSCENSSQVADQSASHSRTFE
jgi:hypothetical protein